MKDEQQFIQNNDNSVTEKQIEENQGGSEVTEQIENNQSKQEEQVSPPQSLTLDSVQLDSLVSSVNFIIPCLGFISALLVFVIISVSFKN